MGLIPKVIHYCWFGNGQMTEKERRCIASWKKICPDYEIKCWNEENYDMSKNQYMQQAYENKKWSFVSDYARLDIIYNYGGIYLDTDVELIRPLDALLGDEGFIGFETKDYVATGLGFGACKQHPIIGEMLDMYKNLEFISADGTFNMVPCPKYNTKVLENHGLKKNNTLQIIDGIKVYPKEYFCPKDYYSGKIQLTENTYSIHHYTASWKTTNQKIRYYVNKVFRRVVGVERGDQIVKFLKRK